MKKNRIPSEANRRTIRAGHRYGALVLTVLACLIFSAFAASGAPIADTSLPVVTMSWQYVAQTIFNMLILVALIKGAERIAKEMFGL